MVVSAAKRAQRTRREKEQEIKNRCQQAEKYRQQAEKSGRQAPKSQLNPIVISDTESPEPEHALEKPSNQLDSISAIKATNNPSSERWFNSFDSTDINEFDVLWLIDNHIADDDDLEECDEEILIKSMWPIFYKKSFQQSEENRYKRKNINGEAVGYQKPQLMANNKKLKPARVPKQTAFSRREKQKQEAGGNDIRFYFSFSSVTTTSKDNSKSAPQPNQIQISDAANRNLEVDNLQEQPNHDDLRDQQINNSVQEQQHELDESELAHELWIQEKVLQYRNSKPKNNTASQSQHRIKAIEEKWTTLEAAINQADLHYKSIQKKDPSFQFPTSQLGEICEFNNQRRELELLGAKSPAVTASVKTAESSIRRETIHKHLSSKVPSGISRSRHIRAQAQNILDFKELIKSGRGLSTPHPCMLDDQRVFKALYTWAASKKPGEVTPQTFHQYANIEVLPKLGFTKTISQVTAYSWMRKLGFQSKVYQKSLYFDGHERPDVVAYREKYLVEVAKLRKRSVVYEGDDMNIKIQPDPAEIKTLRPTVFVYHDESTVHANKRPRLSWLMPNTTEFRMKSEGRLIHISDFILESTGRLTLTPEQQELHRVNVNDAAVVIYPSGRAGGDSWWDMEQLISQVKTRTLPIFNALHPESQGVFVFDCSSAHEAFGPNALRVNNMNLGTGGKQAKLRSTEIPTDDPNIPLELRGLSQTMVFPEDYHIQHLAGKAKGVQVILEERGLWGPYKTKVKGKTLFKCDSCKQSGIARDARNRTDRLIKEAKSVGFFINEIENNHSIDINNQSSDPMCCAFKILSQQSDFLNEKPLLQKVIEEAGHVCLFLPKFHCELNPIEIFWSYTKDDYRKHSRECKGFAECKTQFEKSRKSCPVSTIRRYFRKIDRQHSAYRQGYDSVVAAKVVKLYSSHRCVPRNAACRIDVLAPQPQK